MSTLFHQIYNVKIPTRYLLRTQNNLSNNFPFATMKIIVKGIPGGSSMVEVDESTTILELKKKVANDINIPVAQQTIVLLGKALQDDKTIGFYSKIKDGTKLCAVKRVPTLDVALTKFLRQYYSYPQCSLIVREFMKDFNHKVSTLSLDDLERIAKLDMDNCSS